MNTLIYAQSEYNLLSNAIHLDELVITAKEYGYKCVALSDSNMFATYKFLKLCKKNNIKPIVGLEINIINHEFKSKLLVYAKNFNGYKELLKISNATKISNKEFALNELSKFKDVIFVSTFNKSELLYNFMKSADLFANIYEEYNSKLNEFYVGISVQDSNNVNHSKNMINFCLDHNIFILPLHQTLYKDKDDYIVYESVSKIGQKEYIRGNYNIPTIEELEEEFSCNALETYVDNFVDKIDLFEITIKKSLPHFDNPYGLDSCTYLRNLSEKGLKKRLSISKSKDEVEYVNRLNYELEIISKMGYDDYFLIVWDYVLFAKKNNVMVGPGRGSACGSLVAYSLGITNVDPLKYDLLFERFLNPSRVTMPDIDMDFPDDKRAFVINYVYEKYGKNRVCNIQAFDTFKIKVSLRDLGKALGIESNKLKIIISEASQTKEYDDSKSKDYDSLIEKYQDKNDIYTLLTVAKKLQNLPRHTSTHASGIIISSENIEEIIPLQVGMGNLYQSEWDSEDLANLGLLKMDFLGIKNLQIIDNCCKEIGTLNNINLQYIPLDNEETFKLLRRGDTLAIFQLESEGMTNVLKKLKPTNFNDLVAVLALYRPGPMKYIPTYIERKNGKPFNYIHPNLEPILKSTYGIIVYQEQIMQIANVFAGMSLGEADLLRRAVSKKDESIIEKQKLPFVTSCIKNGYTEDVAIRLYEDIEKFAKYGFNKSHAVGYALLSYQMAYLKANYPVIFMNELLNSVIGSQSELIKYINYAKIHNVIVYSPNINISSNKFVKYRNGLILPLQAIKGVGNQLTNAIINERNTNGEFKNFSDFVSRVSATDNVLKELIYSCAFDQLTKSKKQCIDFLNNGKGTYELFLNDIIDKSVEEYDNETLKSFEIEAIGFNIKYDNFKDINFLMKKYQSTLISTKKLNMNINVLIEFREIKELKTKKNDRMAVGQIYDSRVELAFVMFPKVYEIYKTILNIGSLYLANARLEYDEKYAKYQLNISSLKLI